MHGYGPGVLKALSMRLAVLFHRFGPYHWARLQATGRRCDLYGIETSSESKTYAWDRVEGEPSFEHRTVYPGGDIRDLPLRQISARIENVLENICPDVLAIHGWAFPDALTATAWCVRTDTSSVIMSASTEQDFSRSWWKEALKRRVVQLHQAGLVGGTRHVEYLSKLGMPESVIKTGYDVVDNQHFARGAAAAREQSPSLRKQLHLPDRYFLVVCRFVEKKNLYRLFNAYARYRDQSKQPWDLVLLGDGPLKNDLLTYRDNLHLSEYIHFPGFKQYGELPAYYGLASAFVLASTTEQWGLVVNEAMAAGLPVLVSERCGCIPELIQEGKNGFTFDPCNTIECAEYMEHLASRKCDRKAMRDRSREIISNWTPETFADGLLAAAQAALSTDPSCNLLDEGVLQFLLRFSAARY